MGQQLSIAHNEQLGRSLSSRSLKQGIDHEGILKFRSVPFRGSTQVSTTPALFLENADYTLKGILESRHNTNKLLTEEDLIRLLESVLYTLAYLQSKSVLYRDLVPENIYYLVDEGTFKLLPPELVEKSSYDLMLDGTRFSLVSPEMLIALRQQRQWFDDNLYQKSNVFMLGMIMLEAATLQPSCLCYEDNTLDILDRVIRQRLDLIRRVYPEEFAQLLEKMLEYDATQRMNPQQLALYLNQYFNKLSGVKSAVVVEPPKPYLSTHPNQAKTLNQSNTVVNQSQVASQKQSSIRFNHLTTSNIVGANTASIHQSDPIVRENYLTPPKVKNAVVRQGTPTKVVVRPIPAIVQDYQVRNQPTSTIPQEVLKYASKVQPVLENPEKPYQVNVIPTKKELTNDAYLDSRQAVLNKYSRAKDVLTAEVSQMLASNPRDSYLKKTPTKDPKSYYSPARTYTPNRFDSGRSTTPHKLERSAMHKPSLSPPPILKEPNPFRESYFPKEAQRYRYLQNPLPSETFDSPIRTRPTTDEFSPPLGNVSHRVRLQKLQMEENSTDQSINRIKQEIEKSRRLIQEFQMRNRASTEPPFN